MKSVLQVLSILIGYAGSLDKNKRRILFYACLSNIISILMFITTGRIDSITTSIIIGIRCILFLFKDKYKTPFVLWICIIAHLLCGVITYTDVYSFIPLITTIVTCFLYWYGSALQIKYVGIVINSLWIIYYVFTSLYLVAINTFINIILSIISIFRIKKDKRYV